MPQHRSRTVLFFLTFAAPIAFYYGALYHLSLPVPILDDFNATLNFLTEQSLLHALLPRLLSILRFQHGDYRWIFPHLLMATQFALSGRPNFAFYIFTGNIFLLPTVWLIWLHIFPEKLPVERAILFLPAIYLLFQFSYAEMLDFPIAGLQLLILPFALATLHLLLRQTKRAFFGACVFAVSACATTPQGFLLAPIGLAILLPARNPRRIVAWCLTLTASLAGYLHGYHSAPPPALAVYIGSPIFFLSFLGGCIENMHRQPLPYASVALGMVLAFTFTHSIKTGYYKINPFCFFAAVWTYLTAALVTFGRIGFGLEQSLSVRYKIYCSLLLALAYLYWTHRVLMHPVLSSKRKRSLYAAVLTLSMLFCIAADTVGYHFLSERHDRILNAFAFYRADPAHNAPYINYYINGRNNGEANFERNILNATVASGLYIPPVLPPRITP